jgi:hypothetical protein
MPKETLVNTPITAPGARFGLLGTACTPLRPLLLYLTATIPSNFNSIASHRVPADLVRDGLTGNTGTVDANNRVVPQNTGGASYLDLFLLLWSATTIATLATSSSLKVKCFGEVPVADAEKGGPAGYAAANTGAGAAMSLLSLTNFGGSLWVPLYDKDGNHEIDMGAIVAASSEAYKTRTDDSSVQTLIQGSNKYVDIRGTTRVVVLPSQAMVIAAGTLAGSALLGKFCG